MSDPIWLIVQGYLLKRPPPRTALAPRHDGAAPT